MASDAAVDPSLISDNPLLKDFVLPPFDVVEAKHVRPGIRELIRRLVRDFFFSSCSFVIMLGWKGCRRIVLFEMVVDVLVGGGSGGTGENSGANVA